MGEKRAIDRKVILALAIFCIIIVGTLGAILQNLNSTIQSQASKGATISSLNSKINSLDAKVANLQNQSAAENSTIASLQNQLESEVKTCNSLNSTAQAATAGLSKTQSELSSAQNSVASDSVALQTEKNTVVADNIEVSNLQDSVNNLQAQVSLLSQNTIGSGFSMIQITDTQFLSDSNPSLYDGLTGWIVNNSRVLNIAMVVHTGDIVQVAKSNMDWQAANTAMIQLYNNDIPYCWCAGNHDLINLKGGINGEINGPWIGWKYPAFNVTVMKDEPYWVSSIFNGTNTAVHFAHGKYAFMIINIEYDANQTVLAWAKSLIDANPTVNVIVATHNFLDGDGSYGFTNNAYDVAWATNFEKWLNQFPNVFLTLNGHDNAGPAAFNHKVGNREEIFFNRQELDNKLGAATARIYTFSINNSTKAVVHVYTYQTYLPPHFLTDPTNQFSFPATLTPNTPSKASIPVGDDFLGSDGYSVSFANSSTLQSFTQYGNTLTFNGLTMNGATSNFTVTAVGADVVITNYNATQIAYTVSGSGGSQMFSAATEPSSVIIDGTPAALGDGWSYSSSQVTPTGYASTSTGEVTVTGAASSVTINF